MGNLKLDGLTYEGYSDLELRAALAFRTVALSRRNDQRTRAIELFMASDSRTTSEQLMSLALAGARSTADELRAAGSPVPPAVADAVNEGSVNDPRAGAWTAVQSELDGQPAGSANRLRGVYDKHGTDGVTDAVAYLAKLYREARDIRRGGGQDAPTTSTATGEGEATR